MAVELAEGATIDELYQRLGDDHPELAPALRSALPVIAGRHAERSHPLAHGDEVALLIPVAGGEHTTTREEPRWPRSR